MTDAIGYTRLSQTSDTSIDRQKRNIRTYADDHGFTLQGIHDDGERTSGFNSEREEFQAVREKVSDGAVDAILVNDKKRLARDFDDTMRLILDCRQHDIQIHTHQSGQLDISDPMSAAIEVVQAASDYEAKKKEIERATNAVEERIENGCYHGTPPFGLEFAPDKCHLQKHPREWDDLEEILDRRGKGETVQSVADEIGVSPSTVSRVTVRGLEWYEAKLAEYSENDGYE